MTEQEYRQDDRTEGYCPSCGQPLVGLTTTGRGFCEHHGWRYANWTQPNTASGTEADTTENQEDTA